jgi:hypothetical protein
MTSKPTFYVPRGDLERKPKHGAPCNRCGLCCRATLCQLAQCIFARPAYPGPCPALRKQGDNYHCDIVANPRAYSEGPADKLRDAARIIIGAGAGCEARFNGEPADRAFYRKIEQWDREHAAEIAAARKIWGIE